MQTIKGRFSTAFQTVTLLPKMSREKSPKMGSLQYESALKGNSKIYLTYFVIFLHCNVVTALWEKSILMVMSLPYININK